MPRITLNNNKFHVCLWYYEYKLYCLLLLTVLFAVLPLIFGHSVFLCSDSNALEAFNNPTVYCQAQGKYEDIATML